MVFSIIIPVYNIEKYIGECIESVLNQTFTDFELILIDDGSTDHSLDVIKQYQNTDARIILIHQDNAGPGSARNAGIRQARGEYIVFFDGDDFLVKKDALAHLYEFRAGQDILVYPIKYMSDYNKVIRDSNVKYESALNQAQSCEELYERMLREGKILSSPCEMMFDKSFLVQNNLFFLEGVFSEDIEWIIRIMLAKPKIQFVNYEFYCYRFDRAGSTCNSQIDPEREKKIIGFIRNWYEILKGGGKNSLEQLVLHYVAYHYCVACCNTMNITNLNIRNRLLLELKLFRDILKYDKIRKVKIFHITSNFIGLTNTAKLSNIRYKRKRKKLGSNYS